jgi:hypothetical protein
MIAVVRILVIKGGAHFLRHCQPFIGDRRILLLKGDGIVFQYKNADLLLLTKNILLLKGGWHCFSVQKCRPPFTNKKYFITKRRMAFFFSTKMLTSFY